MINLARARDTESPEVVEAVLSELKLAGVPAIEQEAKSEVPYHHRGEIIIADIDVFTFHRAWYYWVVRGRIPLHVAVELYKNPIGKKDVRVSGHCMCPPPEKWIDWLFPAPSNVKVWSEKSKQECLNFIKNTKDQSFAESLRESMGKNVFSDYPANMGAHPYVTTYHVDSQEGLNMIVKAIKSLAG